MKPLFLLPFFMLAAGSQLQAQSIYPTTEYIDIGNISAPHMVHGDMWRNLATSLVGCIYPKGSSKTIAYSGGLWTGGYDASGPLKVAAQTYRQKGTDYWPGPIDTTIAVLPLKDSLAKKWSRIWKIDRSTIDSFRSLTSHTINNTPPVVLQWPAKGNIYAIGANNASLTINRDMAPFVDVDGNGIYNALQGDYPQMKGDQMLWWIINDYYFPHTESRGTPLGIEIQNAAYAYKRNGTVDNIIFYEYLVTNKTSTPLNDWRLGLYADLDLGWGFDDYMGFDSSRRMGFVYNARNPDGNGEPTSYGSNIPASAIVMLESPGDNYPNLTPVGSFVVSTNNQVSPLGNPTDSLQYYHFLNAKDRTGAPAGSGNYMYPAMYMCDNGFPKTNDLRLIMATQSNTLQPGKSRKIAWALIASPNAGACPSTDLTGLNHTADTAITVYWNPLLPPPTGIETPFQASRTLNIYPNPAKDVLFIKPAISTNGQVSIVDVTGRSVAIEKSVNGQLIHINISNMAPGVYTVIYKDGARMENNVFVKE